MKPKIVELSLIFLGDFNPSIFHPTWLVHKELIKETEGENAEVEVISKNASVFSLDSASFEITNDRFQLRTSQESYFESARDLAFSIFKILNETPLKNLGINHIYHYQLDKKKYAKFGESLCPFDRWKNVLDEPRVLKLDMYQKDRFDNYNGAKRIIITPSDKLDKYGLKININDHYDNIKNDSRDNKFVHILPDNWSTSYDNSKEMINNLWKNLEL